MITCLKRIVDAADLLFDNARFVARNVFVFRYISCQVNQKGNKKVVSKQKKCDMTRNRDKRQGLYFSIQEPATHIYSQPYCAEIHLRRVQIHCQRCHLRFYRIGGQNKKKKIQPGLGTNQI